MLESVSGLDFLKCAGASVPADNGHCDEDGCAQVESGNYKVSDTHSDFALPDFPALLITLAVGPASEATAAVIQAPPEILSGWQFTYRTALPPRAPSIIS